MKEIIKAHIVVLLFSLAFVLLYGLACELDRRKEGRGIYDQGWTVSEYMGKRRVKP